MNPDLVSGRRSARSRAMALASASLAIIFLGACEDKRVSAVDTGISRDSAIKIMSVDAKGGLAVGDSLPNIYRRSEYIINAQRLEVLWFDSQNRNPGADTLPYRELTPVVLHDGKVIGRGWDFWDSTAVANRIWVEPKKK